MFDDHGIGSQLALEHTGGEAALLGLKREDCPYDEKRQPFQWNHWVYGNENAQGEMLAVERGYVQFWLGPDFKKSEKVPIRIAIKSGRWNPKHVKVPV